MTTNLLEKRAESRSPKRLKQLQVKTFNGKTTAASRADRNKSSTHRAVISNMDIMQIVLETSLELNLNEKEQLELLTSLNVLNEFL